MESIKTKTIGGDLSYMTWIPNATEVATIEEADLVIFTGGEDVCPDLYGHPIHETTYYNKTRDLKEVEAFLNTIALNKPILGICRGAQFICTMAGGTLIQHQSHPAMHYITTNDGKKILVNSTHHQRQCLKHILSNEYTLLAWAEHLSPYSYEGNNNNYPEAEEVEVCYYNKINSLAIQFHPEMFHCPLQGKEYALNLVNKLLKKEL